MFKKNQMIVYVIALMLVVAGYLNYTSNNNTNTIIETSLSEEELLARDSNTIGDAKLVSSNDINSSNSSTQNSVDSFNSNNVDSNNTIETSNKVNKDKDEYFAKTKLERDTMYSHMIETYENILNSNNSLETQKQAATEEISKINNIRNSIMICENLIKTKGFDNSIVFVNGESVSVIVESDELQQEQVSQIQNIISREISTQIQNIHISNK